MALSTLCIFTLVEDGTFAIIIFFRKNPPYLPIREYVRLVGIREKPLKAASRFLLEVALQ